MPATRFNLSEGLRGACRTFPSDTAAGMSSCLPRELVCQKRPGAGLAASLGPVSPPDLDVPLVTVPDNPNDPGVAAHLAVLDERAADVGLDVNLDLL